MVVYLPVNHVLYQLASSFIFLSYVQVHLLGLRLTLLIAGVFYCSWAYFILYVSGDTFLWNLGHIVINAFLVVPLIKDAWPITLKGEEKEMFERFFKGKLTKKQFRFLISKAKRKEIEVNTQLIQQGNIFDELLFMYDIPKSKKVCIYYNKVKTIESKEGDYVGMLEATFFLRKERSK